jgi:hypothetical protein
VLKDGIMKMNLDGVIVGVVSVTTYLEIADIIVNITKI